MPEETPPLPWLQVVETAIVTKLQIAMPDVRVSPLPRADWNFTASNGGVLVDFAGLEPGPSRATGTTVQGVTCVYDIGLYLRSLKDGSGLYPMIAAALSALLGFRPGQCDPLTLRRGRSEGQEQGVWLFVLTFATQTQIVPHFELPTGPMFNSVEIKEDCDCT